MTIDQPARVISVKWRISPVSSIRLSQEMNRVYPPRGGGAGNHALVDIQVSAPGNYYDPLGLGARLRVPLVVDAQAACIKN